MPVDQGEAILAATGLRQVLAGRAPTRQQVSRSTELEDEAKAAVLGYLAGRRKAPAAVSDVDVPAELPEDAHGAVGDLDPVVAVAYTLAASRALAYLGDLAPLRQLPGLVKKLAGRNGTEMSAMRRAWQVVEDPIAVLGDLAALSDDQIGALKGVYPTLWASVGLQAGLALAEADRELSDRQERAIGRLMGISVGDAAAFQELHRAPEAPKGGGGSPAPAGDVTTPFQRVAAQ